MADVSVNLLSVTDARRFLALLQLPLPPQAFDLLTNQIEEAAQLYCESRGGVVNGYRFSSLERFHTEHGLDLRIRGVDLTGIFPVPIDTTLTAQLKAP